MNNEFSIVGSSMMGVTKSELIDIINKTFTDDSGKIAVITSTTAGDYTNIKMQSVTFGKILEY